MCIHDPNSTGASRRTRPLAVVIEPRDDLAVLIGDALTELGFEPLLARTHVGAATLAEARCPQLLVACIPAYQQDTRGAYLRDCRDMLGTLPTVLLLSDAHSDLRHAPAGAIRLGKPFTRGELLLAVDEALMSAEAHSDD